MIRSVAVRNFKLFEDAAFELSEFLVVVGPNNAGKTTFLQAVAAWSEAATQWRRVADLARDDDGEYRPVEVSWGDFRSVPSSEFSQLWTNLETRQPAMVEVATDSWCIAFEFRLRHSGIIAIRPSRDVREDALQALLEHPLIPVYVPPVSGLDVRERPLQRIAIPSLIASGQLNLVLRNQLLAVAEDEARWDRLRDYVRRYFGYYLDFPSASDTLYCYYRREADGISLELASAASGFLQVLAVFAILLLGETGSGAVLMLDEPDAHLHVLLQNEMYADLRKLAAETGSQLIVVTHSETLINMADPTSLRVIGRDGIARAQSQSAKDSLRLTNTEIVNATSFPRILYGEGRTDIAILRAWATVLDHEATTLLPRLVYVATRESTTQSLHGRAARHFKAMKSVVRPLVGFELVDSDGKSKSSKTNPQGLIRHVWQRYEIESYLLVPGAVDRFVRDTCGSEAAKAAWDYMKAQWPPAFFEQPQSADVLDDIKGRERISKALQAAGLQFDQWDCPRIAEQMEPAEVHQEVVDTLDAIAGHLGSG